MRFEPLTSAEEEMFVREMLIHFGYAISHEYHTMKSDGTVDVRMSWKPKAGAERNMIKALSIARNFNSIMSYEDAQPATLNEMVDEIRYQMGYGWLAWLFIRSFAIPIIKWLWERYHSSIPETIGQKA